MHVTTAADDAQATLTITVEVPEAELAPYLEKAVRRLAKTIPAKGFRPGKAPRSVVEAAVGAARVLEEAVNLAIPVFYEQAVLEKKLEALGTPRIEVTKLAPGNPLIFRAIVATMPDVTLPDYQKTALAREKVTVTEKDVTDILTNLRQQRAQYPEKDGPAAMGDRVWVTFTVRQNGVVIDGGQGADVPLTIGSGAFIPGFEDQLVGMKKGDERTFTLIFPKDYGKKDMAGAPADFAVTMKKIARIELPALTDEFVKRIGKFSSIADLQQRIRDNVQLEREEEARQKHEMRVVEEVAKGATTVLPEPLVESELGKMARELKHHVEEQGGEFDHYLTSIGKSLADLRQAWQTQAAHRVKVGLVLRAVRDKEQIEADTKDIEGEINMTLRARPGDKVVETQATSPAYHEYIKDVIRNRKTIARLADIAQKNAEKKTSA